MRGPPPSNIPRLEQRQRTAQACESCKRRKQKVRLLLKSHLGPLSEQFLASAFADIPATRRTAQTHCRTSCSCVCLRHSSRGIQHPPNAALVSPLIVCPSVASKHSRPVSSATCLHGRCCSLYPVSCCCVAVLCSCCLRDVVPLSLVCVVPLSLVCVVHLSSVCVEPLALQRACAEADRKKCNGQCPCNTCDKVMQPISASHCH
jgi:hypothetical protein